MDFCPYCNIAEYNSFCTCKINQQMCGNVRRCSNDHCYKPTQYMEKCPIRKEKENMTNYRFIKQNKIYIDTEYQGSTITVAVPNPYGDAVPDHVDIVEYKGSWYVKGYEPKEEKKIVQSKKVETHKDKDKDEE